MYLDDQISALYSERSELQEKDSSLGGEIIRANNTIATSFDLKVIKTASSTRQAATQARANIEKRLQKIESEISEVRNTQRSFQAALESAPGELQILRNRLVSLRRDKEEVEFRLGRVAPNLQQTERRLNELTRPGKFKIQDGDDPAVIAKTLLRKQQSEQSIALGELKGRIGTIDRQIAATEAQIIRAEKYLEELRAMA